MNHPTSLPIEELLKDCEIRRQRRSGPGGQHRNKVETGIFIEHLPTGIRAEATEKRTQQGNQVQAIFRLRLALAIEFRTDVSDAWHASDLWKSRLNHGKVQVNEHHDDFPAMIAECLDACSCYHWEPSKTKEALLCSTSQIVKLLKKAPRAFAYLNQRRAENEMSALR